MSEKEQLWKQKPADASTLRDVAKRADVSIGTASRVINGFPNINKNIQERVLQAIKDLNYSPNLYAQNMRRGTSKIVGVMVRDLTDNSLANFVNTLQEVFQEAGYSLLLMCSKGQKELELQLLSSMSRQRIDGLIMTTFSETDEELADARANVPFPVVMLDRDPPNPVDTVVPNVRDGTIQAVSYLLDLGHRRIAIITGEDVVFTARERVVGYLECHEQRGIPVDRQLIRTSGFSSEVGLRETIDLLALDTPPTAIICGGIGMLSGVVRAVRSQGLSIPSSISIIGGADSEFAELATPPMTVVRWDYSTMGRTIADLLLNRIGRKDAYRPRRIELPVELVVRGSCAPP